MLWPNLGNGQGSSELQSPTYTLGALDVSVEYEQ